MATYTHSRENVYEFVDVKAVEDRGENSTLPNSCLYTEPIANRFTPSYSALKV